MRKLNSKIHTLFPDEVLGLVASVCDSRRIDSYQKKMILIQQILKKYNIKFRMLGGATNRLTLMIDGYAIKFAFDRQGYKDNLMEYSLSPELQPYVTKTYETNGYIVVSECVRTMTMDDFRILKTEICRVLDVLATDYLLGDVGYISRNFTNWGIRDNGDVVILDYAYCHRATEKLFSCEVCGEGILRYDTTFSYLMCSNHGICNAKYNYMERKAIQGDQVDLDMIADAKEESFQLQRGHSYVELNDDNTDASVVVVDTLEKYAKYLKEDLNMQYFDESEALSLMIKKASASTEEEKKQIDDELGQLVNDTVDKQDRPRTVVTYEDEEPETYECEPEDEAPDSAYGESISDMIRMLNARPPVIGDIDEEDDDVIEGIMNTLNHDVSTEQPDSDEQLDSEEQQIDDNDGREEDCPPDADEEPETVIDESDTEPEKTESSEVEDVDNTDEVTDSASVETLSQPDSCDSLDDYDGIILDGQPVSSMEDK